MNTATLSRWHRGAFGLATASLTFMAACSGDPGGNGDTDTRGGAPATGGAPSPGGARNGGSGGALPGTGGAALATGGASGGAPGTTGGQSAGGIAGQSAGGAAGNGGALSGGQAGSAGAGGTSASGGAAAGGAAGAAAGGKGGTNQGGSANPGGAGGKGGAAQGGKGGANQGGDAGKGGAGGKGGGGGAGGAGPSGCKGGKVVHFVYFVESDQTYSESQRSDIEKQAFKFQEYWYGQLGGTFYLAEPVVEVIRADHPARWYMDNPAGSDPRWYRLDNVMAEVHRKLGIRNNDPNRRLVNYPIARFDGHVGASNGGAWMDGDDLSCIPTNGVNYPYPPPSDSPAHCMGHVAHEFGHVLGLDHEGPQDGCMIYGFYQPLGGPMCDFGTANVAKIKAASSNAGWLNAKPGQTCAL